MSVQSDSAPEVTEIRFRLNGGDAAVRADPDRSLLSVLRNVLELKGSRFGCGSGECGACSVLLDGVAVTSCDLPLWSVEGRHVTTVEGLGGPAKPHVLQQAFIDEQAMQCGYCVSGILVRAAALLSVTPAPSEREIRASLDPCLCRCGAHHRMIRAVQRAAATSGI